MIIYYTPEEVAKRMKVSRRTVYRWLDDGKLTAQKPVKGSRLLRIGSDQLCKLQAR